MFRLIKIIFNAIFLVLAFIGFNAIGGQKYVEMVKTKVSECIEQRAMENAKKLGNFSNLHEEFRIDNTVNLMGYRAVIAEHKASGQRMFILDSSKKPLLTQEDIKSNHLEKQLKELADKFKYQSLSFEDIKITGRGNVTIYNQTVPYARIEAKTGKFPLSDIEGIVSSVKTTDGSQKLFLAISEKKKYSHLITEEFCRGISES